MATTFKLKLDGEREIDRGIDQAADSFDDLVESAERVNATLDDQGKSYQDLREEMRKTEKQSDKTFGRKGSGGASGGGIGIAGKAAAAAVAVFALKETFIAVTEKVKELADSGNQDLQRLARGIRATESAWGDLLGTIGGSESFENMAENTAFILNKINGMTQGLSAAEVVEQRINEQVEFQLGLIDQQIEQERESVRIQKMSLEDARKEVTELENQLRSVESLKMTDSEREQILGRILLIRQKTAAAAKEELGVFEKRNRDAEREAQREAEAFWRNNRIREQQAMEETRRRNEAAAEQREQLRKEFEDRKRAWSEEQKAIADRRAHQRQAHQERLQNIRDEAQAKQDALQQEVQGEGGPAQQLLGQQSQADVLRRIAQNRGGTAQDARAVMRDMQRFQQGPGPGENAAEFAKFQEQFMQEGKRAYAQNAAETISSLRRTGKITQEQTTVLLKATKELIEQQEEQIKQKRDLDNLKKQLDAVSNNGRRSRARSGLN